MGFIKGLHHIALKADNSAQFDTAVDFYKNVLGFEQIRSWGEGDGRGIMLGAGELVIEMFASGRTQDQTGTVNHFALATDDVDACIAAVTAAGYKVKIEPKEICIPAETPYPARIAFCYGPVGEEIEFFCEK